MRVKTYGYLVRGYYNNTVKKPKVYGDLALEVWCADVHTKDTEVEIFNNRDDIGRVEIISLDK